MTDAAGRAGTGGDGGRAGGDLPYGPNTGSMRAFLVRFAGLSGVDRARVLSRFHDQRTTRAWREAERALGETIEKSGRESERDALAGPLLQLTRRPFTGDSVGGDSVDGDATRATIDDEHDALDDIDPIAEPALAALLALLVRDLISAPHFSTLYAPFADDIPLADVSGRERRDR